MENGKANSGSNPKDRPRIVADLGGKEAVAKPLDVERCTGSRRRP
jgi:hypothetical protein